MFIKCSSFPRLFPKFSGTKRLFWFPAFLMGQSHSAQEYIEQSKELTAKEIRDSFTLGHMVYNTQTIVTECPVRLHPKKDLIYNKACPPGTVHNGNLFVSRYSPIPLNPSGTTTVDTQLEMRQDIFDYKATAAPDKRPVVDWWVNFADPSLFVAYAGRLFAQDEIQVAEHPALGHLKEKLQIDAGNPGVPRAITRQDGRGTPILIRNIERRCSVAVDANDAEGRPDGLYGNTFARSSNVAIDTATTVINPPTITNMIAMAALSGGSGSYTWEQVVDTYTTAYTSFKAAQVESKMAVNDEDPAGPIIPYVVVHTGNWGCGAFGGSRPLMALLQCLAARSAGVDKLVYHTFNKEGTDGYDHGVAELKKMDEKKPTTRELLEACVNNCRFLWGESDGN